MLSVKSPPAKYRLFGQGSSSVLQDEEIPLSHIDPALSSQVSLATKNAPRDKPEKEHTRSRWYLMCYLLHIFLVILHLLLIISAFLHLEHRITTLYASTTVTVGLSSALQTFYTIYTTLLVFVTQSLMLSTVFSGPAKLTEIHDICGAWRGLGTALSALWQQTKVTSSIFSVALVTAYFICVSGLHIASSSMMAFQPFNETMNSMVPAVAMWPGLNVNLSSLNWTGVAGIISFSQELYGNTNQGLANNTLYDVPSGPQTFVSAVVHATTLDAHCGLLTNLNFLIGLNILSINNIAVSTTGLEPFNVTLEFVPLPHEIWLPPQISYSPPFIIYLVTAEITNTSDASLGDSGYVDVNSTFVPPWNLNATENVTTSVACTLNATAHTAVLRPSGIQLDPGKQPSHTTWQIFSPNGDTTLTSGISSALYSANSFGSQAVSPNCQPVVNALASELYLKNISSLNGDMISALGMNLSSCDSSSLEQPGYRNTLDLLTRDQVESFTAQVSAQFIWLAGQVGNSGGGFDRQAGEAQTTDYVLQWRLNINILSVIFSLCVSIILCVLLTCMLWGQNTQQAIIPALGTLEIMWFGSQSQVLQDQLCGIQNPSVDTLRIMSMFQAVLWRCGAICVHKDQETSGIYHASHGHTSDSLADHAPAVLHNKPPTQSHSGIYSSLARSPLHDGMLECLHESESGLESTGTLVNLNSDLHPHGDSLKLEKISHSHQWCYALHIILMMLHIVLLFLLVYHPEHAIIIPLEDDEITTTLSIFLQAMYTLYCALLVFILQQLALSKIICEKRNLTAVHDVSGAWSGIGTAVLILWKQRKTPSPPREVILVVVYLASILVLHLASPSVIQWQAFGTNSVLQSDLALPDNIANIGKQDWGEISTIVVSITGDPSLPLTGLSNSTLYDIPKIPNNTTVSEVIVNATTLKVQCGLVPNVTVVPSELGGYTMGISLNGTDSGFSSWVSPTWKDVVHQIIQDGSPISESFPQTIFYVITSGVSIDDSVTVHDLVAINMNWTYAPPGQNSQTSTTLAYVAACTITSAPTVNAVATRLNLNQYKFVSTLDEAALSTTSSWSAWSPAPVADSDISIAMASALRNDSTALIRVFSEPVRPGWTYVTELDNYTMSLLGLNLTAADEASATQSSANPSVTLTPAQLENAVGKIAASFLWLAGQIGESAGGFDRPVGESIAIQSVQRWRLNVNTSPVIFASLASFTALTTMIFMIGKYSPRQCRHSVSGTSVLECFWLGANSEAFHSRMQMVEDPFSDKLRAVGMFEIRLGDIRSRSAHSTSESEAVVDESIALNSPEANE